MRYRAVTLGILGLFAIACGGGGHGDTADGSADTAGLRRCKDIDACWKACPARDCDTTCGTGNNPDSQQLYNLLFNCAFYQCSTLPDPDDAACGPNQGGGLACQYCEQEVVLPQNDDCMIPPCGACYKQYAACQADTP
jgi:hypothetical protein